ncbi:hypothetical protein ND925_17125 [Vibrio diabolicus]|uniref:hypothetical protein n=1 Tax=Vibrio diabolicus TaxID=50719 RepID=UPI00215EB852|nr:hypothetical protein [Vibrio diabolicus]MCS0313231.1 hypothetical protein [Vibrio diabolicus]MCS0384483.1 hypothetical protein [Vibrio diabolicus]
MLNEIELKDIAVILSGLVTAVSTLSAVFITSYFNHKLSKSSLEREVEHKKVERKIEKLEEFYLLFEKWEVNFSNVYLLHYRCYKGKLDYSQVLESTSKPSLLLPGEAQKLLMLLNVHLQELIDEYKLVDKARSELVPFLCDPSERDLSADKFCEKQQSFESVCQEFKKKVCTLASKL